MTTSRSLVDVIADEIGGPYRSYADGSETDKFNRERARRILAALSAAGLPQAALEGILAGTHVVVPRNLTIPKDVARIILADDLPPHACPFCGEDGFDLDGMKIHFERGWCDVYESIMPQWERERLRLPNEPHYEIVCPACSGTGKAKEGKDG